MLRLRFVSRIISCMKPFKSCGCMNKIFFLIKFGFSFHFLWLVNSWLIIRYNESKNKNTVNIFHFVLLIDLIPRLTFKCNSQLVYESKKIWMFIKMLNKAKVNFEAINAVCWHYYQLTLTNTFKSLHCVFTDQICTLIDYSVFEKKKWLMKNPIKILQFAIK